MKVHIFNSQQDLKISSRQVSRVVKEVLRKEDVYCNEVSIHFVDTETICALHADYFDDPSTTDCISFPMDQPNINDYCILGEVFVCPKTAIDYAKRHETAINHETTLYIVHGLLHLLGYDDLEEKDEIKMRAAEKLHMKYLEEHNLVLY